MFLTRVNKMILFGNGRKDKVIPLHKKTFIFLFRSQQNIFRRQERRGDQGVINISLMARYYICAMQFNALVAYFLINGTNCMIMIFFCTTTFCYQKLQFYCETCNIN